MTSSPAPSSNAEQPGPLPKRPRSGWRTALLATLLILAGVANHAQSLRVGFAYDDYLHQYVLRGLAEGSSLRPWNLYDFSADLGPGEWPAWQRIFFWWTDLDWKARFFRPVSSLSIWLDFAAYGDWTAGYHVTSLVLFAALLALTLKLYRDLGASRVAALWALAFLALDDTHSLVVGWTANRNTLLATLFTVATVLCVHHHRRSRKLGYLLLAAVSFLLAIGSKESGFMALPLVALYLLAFGRPSEGEALGHAAKRLSRSRPLWILALLAAGYASFYFASGYGVRSLAYPTPWGTPGQYLTQLAVLLPVGLLSLLFGFVSDMLLLQPQWTAPAVALGVVLPAAAGVVLLRVVGWTRLSAFALGWTVLALLPQAGVTLSDRLLMSAAVGTALLAGLFLERLRPLREQFAARRYARLALAGLLLLAGPIAGVPMAALRHAALTDMVRADRHAILNADIDRTIAAPRSVFLLNSPSGLLALEFLPTWSVTYQRADVYYYALQMGRRPLTWQRLDDRTMILTSNGTPFLDHIYERLLRTSWEPPSPGTKYETPEFTATVLAVERGGVRSVQFRFNRSLADASYHFLVWQDDRLVRIAAPAIGQTVELAAVPPPTPFTP